MIHRSNDYLAFLAITLAISAVPALAAGASTAVNGTIKSDQESISSTLATNTDTQPTIAGSSTGNTTVVTPVDRTKSKMRPISPALPTDGSQPVLNSTSSAIGTTNAGAGVGGTIRTGGKKGALRASESD